MKNRSTTESRSVLRALAALAVAAGVAMVACSPQGAGGLTERLSVATGGTGGVYYPYGGGVAKVISDHLEGVEATAEVTAGTVDNLKFISNRGADRAFVLADSLDDAAQGRGAFADFGTVPARALAVLYDNLNQLVTIEGKGIESVADLRDRVVSTGAPGSGTEITALRVLEAVGLDPDADIPQAEPGGRAVGRRHQGRQDRRVLLERRHPHRLRPRPRLDPRAGPSSWCPTPTPCRSCTRTTATRCTTGSPFPAPPTPA